MSQQAKQEARLASIETELHSRLESILSAVVEGARTTIFTNSEFNPHGLLAAHYNSESDDLLAMARQADQLRESLALPVEAGPGHLYIEACRELSDLGDDHRLGPRRLAARLLSALAVA